MSSLNIMSGEQNGTHFDLSNRSLSLGREASRDIQIVDPKVSRKHALIKHEDEAFIIKVTEGKNPIQINGRAIQDEATLKEGDLLTIGDMFQRRMFRSLPELARVLPSGEKTRLQIPCLCPLRVPTSSPVSVSQSEMMFS